MVLKYREVDGMSAEMRPFCYDGPNCGWSESPFEMGEIAARQESLHARVPTTGTG